jgi:3-oxoacyl-[acyl-carrier-protein] synthase-3
MLIKETSIYLPEKVITNQHFVDSGLQTTTEWIETKTGIIKRHFSSPHETPSYMGASAVRALVDCNPDLLIVSTCTSEMRVPCCASVLAEELSLRIPCFDISNSCSGFIYSLLVAESLLKSNVYKEILIVCSERSTDLVDQKDRSTAVFFGDAATATVVKKGQKNVLASVFGGYSKLCAINSKKNNKLTMNGHSIWDFTIKIVPEMIRKLLDQAKVDASEISCVLAHQPNVTLLRQAALLSPIPFDKFIEVGSFTGNTISCTIPLALHFAIKNGKLQRGQKIMLIGWGAGLSWGGMIIEY